MGKRTCVLSLTLFALAVAGCADDDAPMEVIGRGACAALESSAFVSEEPQTDCGPPGGGTPPSCTWSVELLASADDRTEYRYYSKDNGVQGYVQCENGVIYDVTYGAEQQIGTYVPSAQRLVWHGVSYVLAE